MFLGSDQLMNTEKFSVAISPLSPAVYGLHFGLRLVCNSRRVDVNFQMIRHEVSAFNLELEMTTAVTSVLGIISSRS